MKLKYQLELEEILRNESKLNLKLENSIELIKDYKNLEFFQIYTKNIEDLKIQESLIRLYEKQINDLKDRKLLLLEMEYSSGSR